MSLTFDEDLGKREIRDADNKFKSKNSKRKNLKELKESAANEKKKARKEMMSKTREEVLFCQHNLFFGLLTITSFAHLHVLQVTAELKAASLTTDVTERRRMQSDVLSAVFQTFFRVLKHALRPRYVHFADDINGACQIMNSLTMNPPDLNLNHII